MGSSLATLSSRLVQSLLSFVFRLSKSTAPVLRSWTAWLWRALLTSAVVRHQHVQLHASDVPGSLVASNTGSTPEEQANLDPPQDERPPPAPAVDWKKMLSRLLEHAQTSPAEPQLTPATPETGSQRYKSKTAANLSTPDELEVPIGQKKLMSLPSLSRGGWTRYVHPEGVVLFYHKEFRIFTEHDISKPGEERKIFTCAAKLVQYAIELEAQDVVTLDDLTQIVLNVDDNEWCYYFVDHTNRLLFWVHAVAARNINIDLQGIDGLSHLKYMIEALYWYVTPSNLCCDTKSRSHCEYYPHNRVLAAQAFEDLRGMLNYAKIDVLTTDSSSSPFGQDELSAMLELLDSLKALKEISDPYSIWAIARMMAYFTENQFLNFYGQPCARLNADNALFGKMKWNRQLWFRIINAFLLGFPNEHALRLHRVWVDGMIIQPRWKDFITRLTTELGRYTIFSTVMLAVNFNLLSSPGVVLYPASPAGPIQIIVYCSVVSTVASIVFSFGLLNVYSNPRLLIARNVLEAMWDLSQSPTGMASLAITHSLPIACLIWSIALFSCALGVQIFGRKERATVSTLSVEFLIIVMFLAMGIAVMWGFSKNDDGDDEDTGTRRPSRRDIEEGVARPSRTFTGRSLTMHP